MVYDAETHLPRCPVPDCQFEVEWVWDYREIPGSHVLESGVMPCCPEHGEVK
jgi:hypothetical protein